MTDEVRISIPKNVTSGAKPLTRFSVEVWSEHTGRFEFYATIAISGHNASVARCRAFAAAYVDGCAPPEALHFQKRRAKTARWSDPDWEPGYRAAMAAARRYFFDVRRLDANGLVETLCVCDHRGIASSVRECAGEPVPATADILMALASLLSEYTAPQPA